MARNVTFTIEKPDGTPWENAVVRAELVPGSFNGNAHYPGARITSERTDEYGDGLIVLEPNETFEFPCVYLFTMPDRDTFEGIVPDGADDIELSEIRALGVPGSSAQYAIIQSYVDGLVDVETVARVAADSALTASIAAHVQAVSKGGTNLTGYAVGDFLYASGAAVLSKLAAVAVGSVLLSGGVATASAWGKVTGAHIDAAANVTIATVKTSGAARIGSTSAPVGTLLHIGDSDVMAAPDSAVLLSRNMTGAGAGHGFADSSTFNRTGTTAYNSFDALPTITGTANYDHYAGFQSRPILQSTGTISYYRGYVSNPSINGPAITNLYHYYVAATGVPALGSVTNQYGLYIASLTAGTALNYAIYTGGNTPSLFGGAVEIQGTLTANALNRATSNLLIQTASTTRITIENGGPVTFAATAPVLVSSTLGVTGAATLSSTLAVTGAVTGGTYNGQTISATANLTGTLGVAGAAALGASLTVIGNTRIGSASAALAPIHIGTNETNTSVDAAVLVSRSLTGATGAGHCFGDNSTFNRTGNTAYNSFDAQPTITGANSYDHYAGYQTRPIFTHTGTLTDYYGHNSNPLFNGPTVTNAYHYYVTSQGAPASGSVTNQYGLYVANLTGASTNYAVYTAGNTPSLFGGAVTVQGALNVSATAALVGNATVGGTLAVTGVTTVTAALRTDATLRVGASAIISGSHIEANSATGTSAIVPTVIRIRSTSNANDWATDTDYCKLVMYSGDGTMGASDRVSIGARFSNAQGSITDLVFGTSNAAAVADRMKITGAGSVVVGGTALATGATAGFFYLPSMAGTPTGAATAYGDTVPALIDTAASKLWALIGGTWKSVTLA